MLESAKTLVVTENFSFNTLRRSIFWPRAVARRNLVRSHPISLNFPFLRRGDLDYYRDWLLLFLRSQAFGTELV